MKTQRMKLERITESTQSTAKGSSLGWRTQARGTEKQHPGRAVWEDLCPDSSQRQVHFSLGEAGGGCG